MKLEILQNCPAFIRDFLTYNETIKGKSPRSVEGYYIDLRTFFRYLLIVRGNVEKGTEFNQIDISGIDLELARSVTITDLYAFMVYCREELGNNTATRARKTSTLRMFFRYLSLNTHQIDENPAELLESPKIKQSLPKHLTLENSIELLDSVDGEYSERNYCILVLFLNCGLRLSELCLLNLGSITDEGTMTVVGKGNKERIVYLNDSCKAALKKYLAVRPNNGIPTADKNALFISRNHRRISPKTVQYIVKNQLEKAGLGGMGFSTHKLRHTAATLMYQHGDVDIRVLKDILGHANLGTTQIYTHVSDAQIKKAVDSNPLSKVVTTSGKAGGLNKP